MTPVTQKDRLIAVETPLGEDVLLLDSFVATEEISRPFRYELTMLADVATGKHLQVSADKLVGKKMTVSIELCGPGRKRRYFNGIVRRFSTTGRDERFYHYRAELVPWLSLLDMRSTCRYFQGMSVPDILDAVFDEAGYKHLARLSTSRSYTKWDYCAQYRETDFNFVSRLMEEEGIFYFFEHPQEAKSDQSAYDHTLVLMDTPAYKECPGQQVVRFFSDAGAGQREDTITLWETNHALLSSEWTLRDSHFEAPANPYEVAVPALKPFETAQKLKLYDYPGEYAQKFNDPGGRLGDIRPEGETTVKLRMEAEEVGQLTYAGTSHCRGFASGYKFKVMNLHGARGNSGPFALASVQHWAVQSPGYASDYGEPDPYRNSFTCIPADVPCRPPRRTAKPVVQGPQTARVVDETKDGQTTEEIWPDKFGRVRVQFPWDREAKFSCWVRVAQPWAGKGWGHQWIPRVGDEVVVDFLEGDPDRPLIIGSVYNGENMPPYALPDNKTQSGFRTRSSPDGADSNFNMLRIEDKKGEEQIYLQGEKDLDIRVKNDRKEWIGRDRHLLVKRDRVEKIERDKHAEVTRDHSEKIGRDHHLKVDGKEAIKVAGSHSLTVSGNRIEQVSGDTSAEATGTWSMKGMTVVIEGMSGLTIKCGGNFITVNPGGVFISGTMVMINSGGSALSAQSSSPVSPSAPLAALEAATGVGAGISKIAMGSAAVAAGASASAVAAAAAASAAPSHNPAADENKPKKAWIEIQLVDEDGKPVPGEAYRVTLPDGSVDEGSLDEKGSARIEHIDPGSCKVTFPNLDKEAWGPK